MSKEMKDNTEQIREPAGEVEEFVKETLNALEYRFGWSSLKAISAYSLLRPALEQALSYLTAQAEQIKELEEIAQLAFDIHSRDPVNVKKKWGVCGVKAEELLCDKLQALTGEAKKEKE